MKIFIGSDPWATGLHRHCTRLCTAWDHTITEVNNPSAPGIPYYEVARRVATAVSQCTDARGIVLCGTGMGMNMVANSFPGISCAACEHPITAHRARVFNNANVLAMGEYFTTPTVAEEILRTFLDTAFGEGVDPARLHEIRDWHQAVRNMESRMTCDNWLQLAIPESVPNVHTDTDT